MSGQITARLAELKIELPAASAPAANYVPFVRSGNLVFISGQLPVWNGERRFTGKLGRDLTIEQGQEAARLSAVNLIAQIQAAADGDLDRVARIVRLGGFVNSVAEFADHPKVVNGASDLIVAVFGDAGRHARTAVGVNSLPFDVAVEIDGIVELR